MAFNKNFLKTAKDDFEIRSGVVRGNLLPAMLVSG
jgi:Dullard-like phosphatase family protein